MHAKDYSLNDVLKEKQQWVIPVYQRHYAWETKEGKQIPKLWSDLEERALEYLKEGKVSPHFVGAIIYSEPKSQQFGTVSQRFLVDGQQRITTFSLTLCAIRQIAREYECSGIINSIDDYLFNAVSNSMADPEREKFKLWSSSYDRPYYLKTATQNLEELRKSFPGYFYKNGNLNSNAPKMLQAYWHLLKAVREFLEDQKKVDVTPEDSLSAILHGFLNGFQIVVVQLDEHDDAQSIFSSLNGNAEPLTAFDLIRNDIFHRAAKKGEDNDELFEEKWKNLETAFWKEEVKQGRLKRPRTDHLITHSLVSETAKEISTGRVVHEYKNYSESRGFSSVSAEVESLLKYSKVYQNLEAKKKNKPEARIGNFLDIWDMSAFHPLVFWIGVKDISDEEKKEAYQIIENYIIRRDICGHTNKSYNKTVPSLIRALSKSDNISVTLKNEIEGYKSEISVMPSDSELKRNLIQRPIYLHMNSKKIRYLFENIELALRTKFDETVVISTDNLNVEHIMPQKWANYWPLSNSFQPSNEDYYEAFREGDQIDETTRALMENRELKKHCIGNLTVITGSLNTSLGNESWPEKQNRIKNSLLKINQSVANANKWDEEDIDARGENLSEDIIKLWAY